jgi:putative nucleotidyltransferase with HDIG domain
VKSIQGELGLMPVREVMEWAESYGKSGTLHIVRDGIEKKFYLQEGRVTFLTSNRKGERVGEFLAGTGCLDMLMIKLAITESQRRGIPFTSYLLAEQILDRTRLEEVITRLVIVALADALRWDEGRFSFSTALPPALHNGPIQLRAANVLALADRLLQQSQPGQANQALIKKLAQRINEGDFDLPPMPDILQRLNQCLGAQGSAHEVMKIIMADQILTAKILKVVNSAYYALPNPVSSLQHAIAYVGFKAIVNIVTAHAVSQLYCGQSSQLREILRHSLFSAFIAKRLAQLTGFDEEEAFVIGLLHDIGKTILVALLAGEELTQSARDQLLGSYHPLAGALVAVKWNLPPVVKQAIRYHHAPDQAPEHRAAAEIAFLANHLAQDPARLETVRIACSHLHLDALNGDTLTADLDQIRATVDTLF